MDNNHSKSPVDLPQPPNTDEMLENDEERPHSVEIVEIDIEPEMLITETEIVFLINFFLFKVNIHVSN